MYADPKISIEAYSSQRELLSYLGSTGAAFTLLGEDAKIRNDFYSLKVESDDSSFHVGILSQGSGVQPSWIIVDGQLFIGYNEHVALLSTANLGRRVVINLLSLFFEFIYSPSLPHMYVLCETAVVAVARDGVIRWRIDTDVICDHRIEGCVIALRLMDEPPMCIDLESGKTTQGEDLWEGGIRGKKGVRAKY